MLEHVPNSQVNIAKRVDKNHLRVDLPSVPNQSPELIVPVSVIACLANNATTACPRFLRGCRQIVQHLRNCSLGGQRVWKLVLAAVKEIQREGRREGEAVN